MQDLPGYLVRPAVLKAEVEHLKQMSPKVTSPKDLPDSVPNPLLTDEFAPHLDMASLQAHTVLPKAIPVGSNTPEEQEERAREEMHDSIGASY